MACSLCQSVVCTIYIQSYSVRRGDPDDPRHRLSSVKPSVTADDEGAADQLIAQGVQCRLHEVLRVVLLLEDLDRLSQAGGTRFLALVHSGAHRQAGHRRRGHACTVVPRARCNRQEGEKKR